MVDPIQRVLMKPPKDAYQNQTKVNTQSHQLHYFGVPNFEKAQTDYERLVAFLESSSVEVHFLPPDDSTSLDSVYTHDPCVISNGGVILCTMGKDARVPESKAMEVYINGFKVNFHGF